MICALRLIRFWQSFNPSFGFRPIQTRCFSTARVDKSGFNPSFGFRPIQTRRQGLGHVIDLIVSIPRSGLGLFRHAMSAMGKGSADVSIPRSGLGLFRLLAPLPGSPE